MPTQTFFRLPAEKKEKILKAAMQEYARVPSSQVSVKNICEGNRDSWGSFMHILKEKNDLGDYLMQEYRDQFYVYIQDIFQKHEGEYLFASMEQFYQALLSHCLADHSNYLKLTFRNLHPGVDGNLFEYQRNHHLQEGVFAKMIGKLVDTDCLRLEQEGDLNNIIELCIMLIRNQLAKAMRCKLDYDTACRQLSDKMEILKHGMQSISETI